MKLPTQTISFERRNIGHSMRHSVELPVLDAACDIAAKWTSWGREIPILHVDGRFYRRARRPFDDNLPEPPGWAVQSLTALNELTAADIYTEGGRLALYEGRLMAAIAKPVWLLRVEDSGNRMHVRENARQAVTVRFSADFASNSWRSLDALKPSQAPAVAFSLTRRAAAEALVPALVADVPYGSLQPSNDQLEILRPDLFETDDVMLSITLIGQMVVGLGHGVVSVLPRAAIDYWLMLRRLLEGHVKAESPELIAIHANSRSLLEHLRDIRSADQEITTQLKRARNACTLLMHRAAADLAPELTAQPEIELGGVAANELAGLAI